MLEDDDDDHGDDCGGEDEDEENNKIINFFEKANVRLSLTAFLFPPKELIRCIFFVWFCDDIIC